MPDRPRDPDCTCKWSPQTGRLWCDHCATTGPATGSHAEPAAVEAES